MIDMVYTTRQYTKIPLHGIRPLQARATKKDADIALKELVEAIPEPEQPYNGPVEITIDCHFTRSQAKVKNIREDIFIDALIIKGYIADDSPKNLRSITKTTIEDTYSDGVVITIAPVTGR